MKSILLLLCLVFSSACLAQTAKSDKAKILGTWASTEDKKYTMRFLPTIVSEYYETEKTSESTYTISKNTLVKTDKGDGQVYKYSIASLSNTHLTLIYLDRGNKLSFRRQTK